MDLSLKTDVVESISVEDFNRNYFIPQKPLVIKGLGMKYPAGNKWSVEYFRETMGEILVDVFDNKNKKTAGSAYTRPDIKMKFADYLDIMSKGEHNNLRIFLFNLFKHNPKLREEFPCPDIFKGTLDNIGYMFFGGKGTTVRIHYDIDMSNVLHTHFGGRKRVVLFSPRNSPLLYCLPFNTYSLVDIDKPDYNRYPALKFAHGHEIFLEHGDSIFMPTGYWHYMTYLDPSFSVSYRKLSPSYRTQLEGLLNLAFLLPFDKVMNKLSGQEWIHKKQQIAHRKANKILENDRMIDESLFI